MNPSNSEERDPFEPQRDKEGREYVFCDENCKAYDNPWNEAELRASLEHWRNHSRQYGC